MESSSIRKKSWTPVVKVGDKLVARSGILKFGRFQIWTIAACALAKATYLLPYLIKNFFPGKLSHFAAISRSFVHKLHSLGERFNNPCTRTILKVLFYTIEPVASSSLILGPIYLAQRSQK